MAAPILVPVDGSSFAEHAIPHALDLARHTGATLHLALVHVPVLTSPASPLAESDAWNDMDRMEGEGEYMESLLARLQVAGVPVRPVFLTGRTAEALASYAEEQAAAFVVMTTHGRGGIQRAWLGSTADRLVRLCSVPILLVRPADATREVDGRGGGRFRRILCAVDGQTMAEAAVRDAPRLPIADDARFILLHAVVDVEAADPGARARMVGYLAALAARELPGRVVEVVVDPAPRPADAILARAAAVDADLIVMGTQGRGGFRRLLLGSVADRVIRGTDRTVLVRRGARVRERTMEALPG